MRSLMVPAVCGMVTAIGLFTTAERAGAQPAPQVEPAAPRRMELPAPGVALEVRAVCGEGGSLDIGFLAGDKSKVTLKISAVDLPKLNHHWGMSKPPEDLKDAGLDLTLKGAHGWGRGAIRKVYFVRPAPHFYIGKDLERLLAGWDALPGAADHEFRLELVSKPDHVEIRIDGRYFTRFEKKAITDVQLATVAGARVVEVAQPGDPESVRFLPLDLSLNAHRSDVNVSSVSVAAGSGTVEGIPLNVLEPARAVDVGQARWLRQEQDSQSFYDPYYKRSGWDSLPETIILNVPKRHYSYAHVLCFAVPGEGRQPEMAVRVARYRQAWDGSGATQADTGVTLPPAVVKGCTAVREVGTAKVVIDGKSVSVPILLAEIPLKTGELAGVLQMNDMDWSETTDFLYLEFTRGLRTRVTINEGLFEKKPLGPKSGIHILAVTLEKAPVDLLVLSDQLANVFEGDTAPALRIDAVNHEDAPRELTLGAEFTDLDGQTRTLNRKLTFQPGSASQPFPLGDLAMGWHAARFTFTDASGRTVWEQPLTLALLPPDTRRAGAESPYGTWWFAGSHYSEPHADRTMPLVEKMGFRHTTAPRHDPKMGRTHENLLRYQVTPSMMRRMRERKNSPTLDEQVKTFVEQWPDTRYAMIFHETGLPGLGIGLPPELLGQPAPVLEGEAAERRDTLMKHIERHADAIRRLAPNMKIILGNSATPFNIQWLRERLDRKYWDCLGMEMAVQKMCPEGQPNGWNLQSFWIARRMCEIYGYDDLPVTSCYEVDYRPTAHGGLSLKRQADWYARDVLHCLAYRLPNINVALIMDCNSSYYSSRWGSTGVCFRHPLMMPKPSYVSLATLTRVLDRAEYVRGLDTGSRNLYCLEFKQGTGYVYAFWTARGAREVTFAFSEPAGKMRIIDSMGRERPCVPQASKAVTRASVSPAYLISAVPLTKAEAGAPEPHDPGLQQAVVVDSLSDAAAWRVSTAADTNFLGACAYTPMAAAAMRLTDGEPDGLQLALEPQPDMPDLVSRCAIVEPANGPLPIAGRPTGLGVWVKGNANWGRVYFEIVDAKDRRWTSNGWEEAPNSWDMSDWQGDMCINFDGWRFVSVGLPQLYASGYYGTDFHNWRCEGDNSKDNRLAYPIRFARFYVTMREKLVYLTELVPATSLSIGLRDVTAFD